MKRISMAAGVAALLLAGAGPGASAQEAPADSGLITVAGDAAASGVRFSYQVPAEFLAATTPVDGGGPVAQASVGSGISRSAASLPFPGEVVIAGPGLFYTVTGMTFPGEYPFYVAAEHPTAPESELGDPSGQYQLSAAATDRSASSAAQALFGPPEQGSGGSRSTTSIQSAPDGSAVASAESVSHALSFGDGVLKITAVRSTSVTRLAPEATQPETERSLVVEGATVAGQPVIIDAGGIKAGTAAAPVPFGEGADQVSAALAQSGLSARVLREDDGTGGTVEVLEVKSRHPLPFAGNPEGVFTWRIGQVTTMLVRTGFLPAPEPVAGEPATEDAPEGGTIPGSLPAAGPAPAQGTVDGSGPAASTPASEAGLTERSRPSSLGPLPVSARTGGGQRAPAGGYDPGPVALVFEPGSGGTATAGAGEGGGATVAAPPPADETAPLLAAPAAAVRPEGLGRVRLLYVAVSIGAALVAGLAGLWWKKGVSWAAS